MNMKKKHRAKECNDITLNAMQRLNTDLALKQPIFNRYSLTEIDARISWTSLKRASKKANERAKKLS